MKICFFTYHFPPHYTSGGEQYAYRVVQQLKNCGHQVEIVTLEDVYEGESIIPKATQEMFEGLPVTRLSFNLQVVTDPLRRLFRNPELGQWTKDYLIRLRPDILHLNSGYLIGGTVAEAGFDLGIPIVLTLHDYWFLCPFHTLIRTNGMICKKPVPAARCAWCLESQKRRYTILGPRVNDWMGSVFSQICMLPGAVQLTGLRSKIEILQERQTYLPDILKKIDLAISPSKFVVEKILEYGFAAKQLQYLPFGLNKTNLTLHQIGFPSGEFHFGYLGQFAPHKGIHILIEAFNKINSPIPCKLYLYGKLSETTPYGRLLRKMIDHSQNVIYAGPYSHSELDSVLQNLNSVIVPSVWYENRPTVIVEAMATKIPVIASRIGGISELIDHEKSGLLVEPGNVKELAGQLYRLVDDPDLYVRLQEGIPVIPSVEQEIDMLISLYKSVLAGRELPG